MSMNSNKVSRLTTKKAEKLAQMGFEQLADGNFTKALDTAAELKQLRYSAAFEIGALALDGLGSIQQAIDWLEEGIQLAPKVWSNWQLLGNLYSECEHYEKAESAYQNALACSQVWTASVQLN